MEAAAEAARNGDLEYFNALDESELVRLCSKKDEDGRSLLHSACTNSNGLDLVRFLLQKSNPSIINARDEDGWTPLMSASSCGHEPIVKLLLDSGASVDQINSGGRTALFYAASKGKDTIIQLLLTQGKASPTIKDCTGSIPLHRAAGGGHLKAIELLLQATPKHMIDARDKTGSTPLLVAVQAGHSHAAVLLVERGGASIEAENEDGESPLSVVSRGGSGSGLREVFLKMVEGGE